MFADSVTRPWFHTFLDCFERIHSTLHCRILLSMNRPRQSKCCLTQECAIWDSSGVLHTATVLWLLSLPMISKHKYISSLFFCCFFFFFPAVLLEHRAVNKQQMFTVHQLLNIPHCNPQVKISKNDESTTPLQQGDCLPLRPALTHPSVIFCLTLLTVTPRIVKPSESKRHWLPRHSSCTLWEDMVIYVPCHCHAVTCWVSGREQVGRRQGWRKKERGGNSSSVLYMFFGLKCVLYRVSL